MRILVVGGGGREHALAWRLGRSPSVRSVACAPGNAGIAEVATRVPIGAEDVPGLVEHAASERYDLTVVGPESALSLGLADALGARGLRVFGCSRAAAEIESSKAFSKQLMLEAGVPTARHAVHTDVEGVRRFAEDSGGRAVVKADGLAAGKGVVVCESADEAGAAARDLLGGRLGVAGARVVVEERLFGREASCMALVDGERVWPLAPCEDHKTVLDGDRGPMTGGMGAICPTPVLDPGLLERVEREVLAPTARALAARGRPFRGLLYAGLMLTSDGPKVLEFNCRFGDPETQPLLLRWEGDLAAALLSVAEGRAPDPATLAGSGSACCVVLAARGYPGAPERGAAIAGLDEAAAVEGVVVFHSGTSRAAGDPRFRVEGGRVLGVTARAATVDEARRRAYAASARIRFEGMHYRTDIGGRSA